jgi:integrase
MDGSRTLRYKVDSMQHGSIRKRRGQWELRYWVIEYGPGGEPVRRQKSKKLADIDDDHRSLKDVQDEADRHLAGVNRNSSPNASLTISEFAENHFIPFVASRRRASTVRFYRNLMKVHIGPRVGDVRLRDFRTIHAQQVLDDAHHLSRASVQRIKTGMTALIGHALRRGYLDGGNPAREARAEGRRSEPNVPAADLESIITMLEKLDEPAKTIVATAAFAGLREAELRGLKMEDFDGAFLYVRRSVWRTHVNETKTPASQSVVPVIRPLRKLLEEHKRREGRTTGWMFQGEKKKFSLNLDNLVKRTIRPTLDGKWKGFHALRRGLATNLYHLGIPAETAQTILRHESAEVTRKHYIKLKASADGLAAMKKLGRVVGREWGKKKAGPAHTSL